MHIHALRFAALGPFAGSHTIDFDGLGGSALFLIDGPTGAGKSSIIDAIVFALYGDVAGRSSDRQRLRSSFASPADESFAELEFSTSFGRYRVRRTPEHDRAKVRGSGVTRKAASVTLDRSTGPAGWESVSHRVGEADGEIARVIGLSRQQFLQTVVLPQGEFATFLAADSGDRLVVLERIFATDIYSRIESILEERRKQAQADRDAAGIEVDRSVQHVRGRLPDAELEAIALTAEDDEAASVLVSLAVLVDRIGVRLAAEERVVEQRTAEMAAAAGIVAAAEARAAARSRVEKARAAGDRAVVQHAATVAAIDDYPDLVASVGGGVEDPDALLAAIDRVTGLLEAAEEAERRFVVESRELEGQRVADQGLEARIATLQRERDIDLPTRLLALSRALERGVTAAATAAAAQARAEAGLVSARLDGMAGELAAELVEGLPCPVCGAEHHPQPAAPSDEAVSPEDIDRARQSRSRADERHLDLQVQQARLQALAGDLVGASPEDEEAPFLDPSEVTDGVRALQRRIAEIDTGLESARAEREAAGREIGRLIGAVAEHAVTVAAGREGYPSIEARTEAMAALRVAVTAVARAVAAVATCEATLAQALTELEGLPADGDADLTAVREERDTLEVALRRASSARDATRSLRIDLQGRVLAVTVAVEARDACVARTADVISLASVVRGGAGNSLSQPLSAYVVQTMFDEILESANRRLRAMLDGRFELRSTESRTGRRLMGLGLGLEVLDLRTETLRRTATLSGGETFCASLALALGLADTVRAHAGGVEIGMLLIDEGFGSLDGDRLDEVMAELLHLRADGRTVGVISHVAEMKRTILERIDVQPLGARDGSTLTVSWTD